MHIEINHDNHVRVDGDFLERLKGIIADALSRFADRITRVECHLGDINASKGGDDKRCMLEARVNGLQPVAVTSEAETLQLAIDGAMEKLEHALDRQLGKLRAR